jgi:hypothetical protein
MNLAARMRIQGLAWSVISRWLEMPERALRAWSDRPEWAQAFAQAVEALLTRIAGDSAFAGLDAVAIARDAALVAAGQPAALEHGLPSAFLAVNLPAVGAELRTDLALAALDLGATGLDELARLIRREQHRADTEPEYTRARTLAGRCENLASLKQWCAVENRDGGKTLTGAERDALYHLRRTLKASGLDRAWFVSS